MTATAADSQRTHSDDYTPPDGYALLLAEVDSTSVIVTAAAAALVGVIAWFGKSIMAIGDVFVTRLKRRAMGNAQHLTAIQSKLNLYREITCLCAIPSVERVLVFSGGNGGGIPTLKDAYNVNCMLGRSTDPTKRPEEIYRGPLRVDPFYFQMLLDIVAKGFVVVGPDTLPADSMLRSYYLTEGVVQARIYFLSLTPERLYYCSVASYTKTFSEGDIRLIDQSIMRIRSLMEADD